MKFARFAIAPVLLLALIATSLYLGLARPGAGQALASQVIASDEVRIGVARTLVDQLVSTDNSLLTALLTSDRAKAESAIARSLSDPLEQQQIATAIETLRLAAFTGKASVEIDSTPIYRPIYQGLDAVFPALNLTENLDDLDPIVIGKDSPLPNLRVLSTLLMAGLLFWPLWILLSFLYIRRNQREGWRLVAIQTLVISGLSTLVTFFVPMLLQGVVTDPIRKVLVRIAMSQLTFAALWISLALVIASTITLLLTRERVLPSESTTQG